MAQTHYQERAALGCRVQLTVVTDVTGEPLDAIFKRLWLEVFMFEKRCSRFLPASELSQFNRLAGQRQPVTPEFRDVLLAARDLGVKTKGVFNPFILPALQRAGYVASFLPAHAGDQSDDHSAKAVVAVDALEIGDDWATIPYGTAIELGGCGKGYIGDRLADIASTDSRLQGFWFSLGGDVVAGGCDESNDNWVVYIQPDPDEPTLLGEARANGRAIFAVATSTTRRRRGVHQGKAWHHIIDPRNGRPADSGLTVATVCGRQLLSADVLASCLIVLGDEGSDTLLEQFQASVSGMLWQSQPGSPVQIRGSGIVPYEQVDVVA